MAEDEQDPREKYADWTAPTKASSDSTHETGQETTTPAELSRQEIASFTNTSIETIGGDAQSEITPENFRTALEQSILEKVKSLPERLAAKVDAIDLDDYRARVEATLEQIRKETDNERLAELQVELISHFISLISKVQNGGDKGFIPSVAEEVEGLDCSLGAWALKQKLSEANSANLKFEFGYPPNHAVGIITDATGRRLYVDAQNALISEVQLQEVHDDSVPNTAYPIYEIISSNMIFSDVPQGGSDYVPKYLGIREDGTLHTLGNYHMLVNKESPTYNTETAKKFRESLHNSPEEWRRFQQFVDMTAEGKVIQETKFGQG